MPQLSILTTTTTDRLVEKYELTCTDLMNSLEELANMEADFHLRYMEFYSHSQGKNVSDRNRTADFATRYENSDIIKLRGQIARLDRYATLLRDLIGWRGSNA